MCLYQNILYCLFFITNINICLSQYSFSLPYSCWHEKEYWLRWFNESRILDSLENNANFIKYYKIKKITKERIDFDSPFQHYFSTNEYNSQGLIIKRGDDKVFYTEENEKKINNMLYYDEKGMVNSFTKKAYGNCGIEMYISLNEQENNRIYIQKCYYEDNCRLKAVASENDIIEYAYLDSFTVAGTIYRVHEPLKKSVYISQFNALQQKILDIALADNLKDTVTIFLYEYDEKNRLILARELRKSLKNRIKDFGVCRLELTYENNTLTSLSFFEWGEENYPIRYCLSYKDNLLVQIDTYSVFAKKRTYKLTYEFYE